jgi:polysaccharide deacetylase 2 family uncharacterized protein YibQ
MLWSIIILVIAVALLLWGPFKSRRMVERKQPAKKELASRAQPGRSAGAGQTAPPSEITAVVAIVVDDLGRDLKTAKEVIALPERVTLAVMPLQPQSRRIAELAQKDGHEIIVHIPMEAKGENGKRQSPGTLRAEMTPMELIAAVNADLDSVPGAAGANNHEGSALTENRAAMDFLMSELKSRGLFFLDSYTDASSVAFTSAREFGIRTARRDVFLDNDSEHPAAIRKQLDELAAVAKKNGRAIGIGHPHPATLAELRKWLPEAAEAGIEIVPLSRLMQ